MTNSEGRTKAQCKMIGLQSCRNSKFGNLDFVVYAGLMDAANQ
jgi:hypothetical protein